MRWQGALLVGLCILAAGLASAQDTTTPEAVSTTQPVAAVNVTSTSTNTSAGGGAAGDELKKQIDDNSEAQEYKETTKPVKAQIVKQEAAANLESGTGDVSTTGACNVEVDQFCYEVQPGEGRLAKCLDDQLVEEGKNAYKGAKVTDGCKAELDKFKIERASNINKDVPLAEACLKDVEKLCKNMEKGGHALACLRDNKDKLTEGCKAEVFERQAVAADDWRTDPELYAACQTDAASNCKNVSAHGGATQECLRTHRALLTWNCQEQLFRQEVENADDLRLSTRLFKSCLEDKKKFCSDVQPGNARAKECLEDHMNDAGFSPPCKGELEKMMEARAADFRMDPKLRTLCAEDIQDVCGYEKDSMDAIAGEDARVIQCLQDYREEINSPACQARVQKIMEYASSDIRFDVPLADACFEDREAFCSTVQPGSARVIRCLQSRRADLSYECKATLFDQEVRMAESIDFQFPMKKACGAAIKQFCSSVPHNHARVIRCLQDKLDDKAMPAECKKEVEGHAARSSQDYRLNYRLNDACHDTITSKCGDACSSQGVEQPCGGTVLRCLTDKLDEITDEDCKKEVFYFIKMEVRDFRNDVILAEACRTDVDNFCADVEPGDGRVHQCLRKNRAQLSERCRAEEMQLSILESSNTELMPQLAKACKAERARHCEGVRPGKARVFNCLLSHSDHADYSPDCVQQLSNQQQRRIKDWRLDYELRQACKADVATQCATARSEEDKDNAAILRCLVSKVDLVDDSCGRQVSRSVRNALSFYQPGLPLLDVCDADVKTHCASLVSSNSIGKVRTCLTDVATPALVAAGAPINKEGTRRLLVEDSAGQAATATAGTKASGGKLSVQCQALVSLAEPGNLYKAFQDSFTATGVATQAKYLEQKLNLPAGTLTPKDPSAGMLTLTGWSASLGLLALMAVAVGGAVMAYRRYKGWDQLKGYTIVQKEQRRGGT